MRDQALRGLLCRVADIGCTTENAPEIRNLIAEAGVEPGAMCGLPAESFTDDMAIEWVLGQWADCIDNGALFALNSLRNRSIQMAEDICGYEVPT